MSWVDLDLDFEESNNYVEKLVIGSFGGFLHQSCLAVSEGLGSFGGAANLWDWIILDGFGCKLLIQSARQHGNASALQSCR